MVSGFVHFLFSFLQFFLKEKWITPKLINVVLSQNKQLKQRRWKKKKQKKKPCIVHSLIGTSSIRSWHFSKLQVKPTATAIFQIQGRWASSFQDYLKDAAILQVQ